MGAWEIKHSNFIAWLLDPKAPHGLGDSLIKGIISSLSARCTNKRERYFLSDLLQEDLCNAIVIREKEENIDILFRTNDSRFVLCIENKVWSDASDNQLDKYYDAIERRYGNNDVRLFAFLTPDGHAVPEGKAEKSYNAWIPLTYEGITECLRDLLPAVEDAKSQLLINDYIDLLERMRIVTNENQDQEIDQLYLDHKEVLDLILARQKSISNKVSKHLKKLYLEVLNEMRNEGILKDCDKRAKTGIYIWFTTEAMDEFLDTKSNGEGSWGKASGAYSYWIYPGSDGLLNPSIQLELGPKNQPPATIEKMNELKEFFAHGRKAVDSSQKYRRILGEPTGIDEHDTTNIDDIDDDGIKQAVRDAINKILAHECMFFEQG